MDPSLALAEELRAILRPAGVRTALVLGPADSGKTTLVEAMARVECRHGGPCAVVDADVGQSHIGPPSTVAWARCGASFVSLESLPVSDMFFSGALSPAGNTAACLEGLREIFGRASVTPGLIICDSDGYVEGAEARRFKSEMVRLLDPDCVIECFPGARSGFSSAEAAASLMVRLTVPFASRKPAASRAFYRLKRFKSYFKRGSVRSFPLSTLSPLPRFREERVVPGKLVGLVRNGKRHIGLGVILSLGEESFEVFTPLRGRIDRMVAGKTVLPREALPSRIPFQKGP